MKITKILNAFVVTCTHSNIWCGGQINEIKNILVLAFTLL